MSPTTAAPRFRTWVGQASNLDRCSRCGDLRSDHGPDWSCPAALSHRASAVLLITGVVLTAAALCLHAGVGQADIFVQTAAFFGGVGLFVAGLTTGGR
jgi:hypothetical protein